ncbi:MAG: glycoside hydrolase family 3 C-terminal domain-containing protein [Blautia sp.]|nr:glycoside hydrolase family 3 C-terminal domain-containing protein [Blautia sp.]
MAKPRVWRGLATAMASVLSISAAAQVLTDNWSARINSMLGTNNYVTIRDESEAASLGDHFHSEFASLADMLAEQEAVSRQIGAEGTVLLKNDDSALPLDANAEKVTLWGLHTNMPVLGGMMGSTAAANYEIGQPQYGIKEAMLACGFDVNQQMMDLYASEDMDPYRMMASFFGMPVPGHAFSTWFTTAFQNFSSYNIGEAPADAYPDEVLQSADGTAAVVLITRDNSEAADYYPDMVSELDSDQFDRPLALSQNEKDMIELAKQHSTKVIVLINSSSAIELEDLKQDPDIDAVLWTGQPGNYGFLGVADVLAGEASPSGKLTDTYAISSVSSPAMVNFGVYLYTPNSSMDKSIRESDQGDAYLVETEGIYEGYRYYETRYEDVILAQGNANSGEGSIDGKAWDYGKEMSYPFGYGLSYTTFEQELQSVDVEVGGEGKAVVRVTNTGKTAGMDVAELFVQAPYKDGGLEKSAVQLLTFGKTGVLEPGASETLELTFDPKYMSSYDEEAVKADGTQGAWVLEDGDYYFAIGNGAHNAINNILANKLGDDKDLISVNEDEVIDPENVKVWNLAETDIETYSANVLNALQNMDINKLIPDTAVYFSRADWSMGWTPVTEIAPTDDMKVDLTNTRGQFTVNGDGVKWGQDNGLSLIDFMETEEDGTYVGVVDLSDSRWDQLIEQVTLEEAINYIENAGNGVSQVGSIGVPANPIQDGPTGFANDQVAAYFIKWNESQSSEATYVSESEEGAAYTMNVFPTEPVVASSFNRALSLREGEMYGEESLWSNIPGTLAPGGNLHRVPYCGRNHEYYSEDPMLTNILMSAFCEGGTEKGLMTEPKHFAFNHQEANRAGASTFMTEQAARENDLRAFQEALSSNNAMGLMTSYNRVGTVYSSAHSGLLEQILRNEWGYQGWVVTDMAASPDYMNWLDSVLNGTGGMLTTSSTTSQSRIGTMTSRLEEIKKDTNFQQHMHDGLKHYMYSIARSNALNGYTKTTETRYVSTWWQKLIRGIEIGTGILSLLFLVLWLMGIRREGKGGKKA